MTCPRGGRVALCPCRQRPVSLVLALRALGKDTCEHTCSKSKCEEANEVWDLHFLKQTSRREFLPRTSGLPCLGKRAGLHPGPLPHSGRLRPPRPGDPVPPRPWGLGTMELCAEADGMVGLGASRGRARVWCHPPAASVCPVRRVQHDTKPAAHVTPATHVTPAAHVTPRCSGLRPHLMRRH